MCSVTALTGNSETISSAGAARMSSEQYRPGTLKVIHEDGAEWICSPHEAMYSTATMVAKYFWNGVDWQLIDGDEPDERIPP